MGRKYLAALMLCVLNSPALAGELTVADVIAMSQSNLGDEVIVAKIEADQASFDLSTNEIIQLKRQGISGQVIAAMIRSGVADTAQEMSVDSPDPMVPHPAGVYLLKGEGDKAKMVRVDPQSASQMKTGNLLGYAFTGGIASMSMKVSIPGKSARVQSHTKPYFYFFFDQAGQGAASASFLGSTYLGNSPADFTLVRLDGKKDRREAKVGKFNIGGMKTGVMDKDRVPIEYEMVRAGVYKVKAADPLEPGEYGFLYSIGGAQAGAAGARIFDFSVK